MKLVEALQKSNTVLGKLARTLNPKPEKPGYYYDVYERFLYAGRNEVRNILEIGIGNGGSLNMWQAYFPNATIHALDILDKSEVVPDGVIWHQGRQDDSTVLDKFTDKQYDLIVDDGSHVDWDMQRTLGYMFQYVKYGGYYVIEDLDCRRTPKHECIKTRAFLSQLRNGERLTSEAMTKHESRYITKYTTSCHIKKRMAVIVKVSHESPKWVKP